MSTILCIVVCFALGLPQDSFVACPHVWRHFFQGIVSDFVALGITHGDANRVDFAAAGAAGFLHEASQVSAQLRGHFLQRSKAVPLDDGRRADRDGVACPGPEAAGGTASACIFDWSHGLRASSATITGASQSIWNTLRPTGTVASSCFFPRTIRN